jgi:hypothetical protein
MDKNSSDFFLSYWLIARGEGTRTPMIGVAKVGEGRRSVVVVTIAVVVHVVAVVSVGVTASDSSLLTSCIN